MKIGGRNKNVRWTFTPLPRPHIVTDILLPSQPFHRTKSIISYHAHITKHHFSITLHSYYKILHRHFAYHTAISHRITLLSQAISRTSHAYHTHIAHTLHQIALISHHIYVTQYCPVACTSKLCHNISPNITPHHFNITSQHIKSISHPYHNIQHPYSRCLSSTSLYIHTTHLVHTTTPTTLYIIHITHWRENFPKIPERRIMARKQGHLMIGGAFICRNRIG